MPKEFIYKRNSVVKEKGEKGISKEIGKSVNLWEKFGKNILWCTTHNVWSLHILKSG